MRIRCAWCKKTIREGAPCEFVSHGICPSCAAKWEADARVSHERDLERERIQRRHGRNIPACQREGKL